MRSPSDRAMTDRRLLCVPAHSALPRRQRAFTLAELVTVLILVGILAVAAIPRFADRDAFAAAGFVDQLTAALKHARKSAVAMRRTVCVALSGADTLTFTYNPAPVAGFSCGTSALALPLPGSSVHVLKAPSSVAVAFVPAALTAVSFDGLGQPSMGASLAVTGSDGTSASVVIEADSGYMH